MRRARCVRLSRARKLGQSEPDLDALTAGPDRPLRRLDRIRIFSAEIEPECDLVQTGRRACDSLVDPTDLAAETLPKTLQVGLKRLTEAS
jgi:hypothetical protein